MRCAYCALPRKKSLLIGPFRNSVVAHPLRQLVVPHHPDIGKAAEVFQDLVQHRGHQRTAAEMAVDGDVEERRGLVLIEVVEGVATIVPLRFCVQNGRSMWL